MNYHLSIAGYLNVLCCKSPGNYFSTMGPGYVVGQESLFLHPFLFTHLSLLCIVNDHLFYFILAVSMFCVANCNSG